MQNIQIAKQGVGISVQDKEIEITGKTFTLQINFDDLTSLSMEQESIVYAEEMELELVKVEEFYPAKKQQIRMAFHTAQISCVLMAKRAEADKIARLDAERFRQIILSATPGNFFKEHEELVAELRAQDGTEEIEYPVHFRACGHAFDKEDRD